MLTDTINFFTPNDEDGFINFLGSSEKNKNLIKLFRQRCKDKDWTDAELAAEVYKGEENPSLEALESLSKRLDTKIGEYIASEKFSSGQSARTMVRKELLQFDWHVDRNGHVAARRSLKAARRLADKCHLYLDLDHIYDLELEFADELKLDTVETMNARAANNKKLQMQRKLNEHYLRITNELKKRKRIGTQIAQNVIDKVLKDKELMNAAKHNAEFMHKLVLLVRAVAKSKKEYIEFEVYIKKVYDGLIDVGAFHPGLERIHSEFIYMITQSSYRNQNFPETEYWLGQLEKFFPAKHPSCHFLYAKYMLIRAAVASYTRVVWEGISMLENTLQLMEKTLTPQSRMDMMLNLSVYYFFVEEYSKANATMSKIDINTDRWIDDHMGKEWRFKKELIRAIIFYELGHFDMSERDLKNIQKNFADFLEQELYVRAGKFIDFILQLIKDPDKARTKKFHDSVLAANLRKDCEIDDLQAITFFCWLQSKMEGRNYYETLMTRVEGDARARGVEWKKVA